MSLTNASLRAAALALFFVAPDLSAHHAKSGWPYPYDCCSDRDCWLMGTDTDSHEPEPTFHAGRWRLHDGTMVDDRDARPSPDGRFHVCRYGGAPSGSLITPTGKPPCLWVPRGAS